MKDFLAELAKLTPGVLAALAALAGASGAVLAALIGKLLVTPMLGARDRQDREAEWRKHALELTKLDLERKLKSGRDLRAQPLRPSILDFLANYRDLQELGGSSPKDLYNTILSKRLAGRPAPAPPVDCDEAD